MRRFLKSKITKIVVSVIAVLVFFLGSAILGYSAAISGHHEATHAHYSREFLHELYSRVYRTAYHNIRQGIIFCQNLPNPTIDQCVRATWNLMTDFPIDYEIPNTQKEQQQ